MIWKYLSAICVLGVVILGMLITTRTIALEQLGDTVRRLFAASNAMVNLLSIA
jgi:hypothetical protein